MNDLYLIAHKVRGEPAFDIAQHITCPKCEGTDDHCTQCDGAGHWWIIPTSGHRAFPYWDHPLYKFSYEDGTGIYDLYMRGPGPMPSDLRDHYTTTAEASISLASALGLTKPPPPTRIARRF